VFYPFSLTLNLSPFPNLPQKGDAIVAADDVAWPELKEGAPIPTDIGATLAPTLLGADGVAHVFPEHKFILVEALRQAGFCVGMTGDGVNDAPALKRAHVGIAVSGATDAARAAADIVLTQPGLGTVVVALTTARTVFRRINNFVLYRTAATLFLILFFFIAAFALPPSKFQPPTTKPGASAFKWPPFFELPIIQLMLLVVLNDIVFTLIGRDRVRPSPRPDKWNLRATFLVAAVLASVPTAACLVALWAALDSHAPGSLFSKLGLPAMPYEKIQILLYLLISAMSFLTFYCARERSWAWSSAPHPLLAAASIGSLAITILLACFWPRSVITGIPLLGLARTDAVATYRLWPVWALLYCLAVFLIQDAAKVGAWRLIDRFDVFHYRTGAMVGARAAHDFGASAATDAATGAVEGRLLESRAKRASESLQPAPADVRAAVASIASERKARLAGRFEAASAPADVEEGGGGGDGGMDAFERALAAARTPAAREALAADVAGVRLARASLAEVLRAREEQVLKRASAPARARRK
jgi:H+-transporting ATPase